jgi:hypothetical protein
MISAAVAEMMFDAWHLLGSFEEGCWELFAGVIEPDDGRAAKARGDMNSLGGYTYW